MKPLPQLLLSLLLLVLDVCTSWGQNEIVVPLDASPQVREIIEETYGHMDASKYDKALSTLSRGFYKDSTQSTLADQYYLHSFESEIMYYTALFDIGLSSALQSEKIAIELKNDTLIGSAKNLVGLMLMNIGDFKAAVSNFKQAIALIPFNHQLGYLSFKYHAQINLGECYLKIGMPDSCIHYTTQAIQEVKVKNRIRGIALAYWNIGEAYFLQNNISQAIKNFNIALKLVENTQHKDVTQTVIASLMKCTLKNKDSEATMQWLNRGLEIGKDSLNTELSRITFLEKAIEVCFQLEQVEQASELFHQLYQLKNQQTKKQLEQRSFLLTEYFNKKQNLEVLKETTKNQQAEISLRKKTQWLLISLVIALSLTFFILFKIRKQRQQIRELTIIQDLQEKQKSQEMAALKDKLEAIHTERNRIASDLHDDIGASLSSIRIYSDAAILQFDQKPDESKKLMERINRSSSDMMEKMSDIIWVINPKNDQGENLILRMKSHLSEVLSAANIKVNYRIHSGIDELRISTFARRNLYLTFKEAINNILKYSQALNIQIEMKIVDGKLIMRISDDGVGFDNNQTKSGNGIGNMKRRIHAIGGSLDIRAAQGKGCALEIELDLTKISE
jgi:two-component system sensor histidine kinase UhpB